MWRRTATSSTCSDAICFSLLGLALSEPLLAPSGSRGSESGAGSDSSCGCPDDVEDEVGVGEHGDVAAVDVVGGGTHPLSRGPLHLRVAALAVVAPSLPARL